VAAHGLLGLGLAGGLGQQVAVAGFGFAFALAARAGRRLGRLPGQAQALQGPWFRAGLGQRLLQQVAVEQGHGQAVGLGLQALGVAAAPALGGLQRAPVGLVGDALFQVAVQVAVQARAHGPAHAAAALGQAVQEFVVGAVLLHRPNLSQGRGFA